MKELAEDVATLIIAAREANALDFSCTLDTKPISPAECTSARLLNVTPTERCLYVKGYVSPDFGKELIRRGFKWDWGADRIIRRLYLTVTLDTLSVQFHFLSRGSTEHPELLVSLARDVEGIINLFSLDNIIWRTEDMDCYIAFRKEDLAYLREVTRQEIWFRILIPYDSQEEHLHECMRLRGFKIKPPRDAEDMSYWATARIQVSGVYEVKYMFHVSANPDQNFISS